MNDTLLKSELSLDVKSIAPRKIGVGSEFNVTIAIEALNGGSLSGLHYQILDEAGDIVDTCVVNEIRTIDPDSDDYDPRHGPVDDRDETTITMRAPAEPGAYTWTLFFPEQEGGDHVYEASSLAIDFECSMHQASLAVWDIPTPASVGEVISVKVGVKCSSGCNVAGQQVQVTDEAGEVVAHGILGEEPWKGTTGLYWTTLDAAAPEDSGQWRWSVSLLPKDCELPHLPAGAATFSFTTVSGPRHPVKVKVTEGETKTPVANAYVRLGSHRGITDEAGSAELLVAEGRYEASAWKPQHEVEKKWIDVKKGRTVHLRSKVLPEEDPYAFWKKG